MFALSYNPPGSGYEKEAAAAAVIELEGGLPIQYGGTFAAARYEFALWIEGSKGDLWTDRKRVWWRPRGGRFFRPCKSMPVPKGDELPYPKAGTVSLLNQFRDAVLEGRILKPAGPTISGLWRCSKPALFHIARVARCQSAEVFGPPMMQRAGLTVK